MIGTMWLGAEVPLRVPGVSVVTLGDDFEKDNPDRAIHAKKSQAGNN